MKKNVCVFLGIVAFSTLNFDLLKAEAGKGSSAVGPVTKVARSSLVKKSAQRNKPAEQISGQDESKPSPLPEKSSGSSLEELVNLQKSVNKAVENAGKEFENTKKELESTREKLSDTEGKLANTKKEVNQLNEKLNAAKLVVIDHIKEIKTKEEEIADHKEKLSQKNEEVESHRRDLEEKSKEISSEKDKHGETARQLSQKAQELAEKQKAHDQQVSENAKMREELSGMQRTVVNQKNHYDQASQEIANVSRRKMEEAFIIMGHILSGMQKRVEEMRNNPDLPKGLEPDMKRLEELMAELLYSIKLVGADASPESPASIAEGLAEQE
ncbi:MAG: hypothetical protein LBJ96_02100 [Holosporaceae bacterium]|nr:hypothetical protein [Holosporaceae bacterium]